MNKVHEATKEYLKQDVPEFGAGDTVCLLYTSDAADE